MTKAEKREEIINDLELRLRSVEAQLREERERTEAINRAVLHPAHRGHCAST